jgi:hypothetical protein
MHGRYLDVQVFDDAELAGVLDEIARADYDRLVLSTGDMADLAFLAPAGQKLRALLIQDGITSLHGLEELSALEDLHCDFVGKPPFAEFGRLSKLRRCFVAWDKKYDQGPQAALFDLPALCDLTLRYWGAADCARIGHMAVLQLLDLRQGAVGSTAGLERCASIKELSLALLPKLTAITPIGHLEKLRLESLPGIASGEFVRGFSSLQSLWLEKMRFRWPNLDWLRDLPRLRDVMNGVEVDRIDWAMVFAHPSLSRFTTKTHEGYDMTDSELTDMAGAAGKRMVEIRRYGTKKNPALALQLAPA